MYTHELWYGLGALALLAVIVWAVMQNRRRNRANDPITEAATREEYSHPDRYAAEEEEFRRRTHPS
ncbi:MAG: hypothetical protein JNK30_14050 [Phenylobacterium sp.]|uniref:hypothetical protein n=1 Tax=Phenylobacterium sp. TaxID=1871053 RepID=UPI001A625805|nr:hypothetical protein [Phenylobacterium sp.]MBL8772501.1 hypothetical protein [Phenylobacterium sp.]